MYLDVVHEHIPAATTGNVPTEPARVIVCNSTSDQVVDFLLNLGEAEWHKYTVTRGQNLREYETRDYLLWMRAI
jgi:hypothetical protein